MEINSLLQFVNVCQGTTRVVEASLSAGPPTVSTPRTSVTPTSTAR